MRLTSAFLLLGVLLAFAFAQTGAPPQPDYGDEPVPTAQQPPEVYPLPDAVAVRNAVYQAKREVYAALVRPTALALELLAQLRARGVKIYLLCDRPAAPACAEVATRYRTGRVRDTYWVLDRDIVVISYLLDEAVPTRRSEAAVHPLLAAFMRGNLETVLSYPNP